MKKIKLFVSSLAVAGMFSWSTGALADAKDDAMKHLARKSGCFICHGIELDAQGPDGLKPVGPPFKAVAARYKGNKDAAKTLTATVMMGSSPYSRHWQNEASGVAMPPNATAINEDDAKKVVSWILGLK